MYGEPALDEKLQAEHDAGRVHFGGCVIGGLEDDPNRYCNDCEAEWNTKTSNNLMPPVN